MTLTTPLSRVILRLELMRRGEGDPVEAAEEEAAAQREVEIADLWMDSLPGGDGHEYPGSRSSVRYERAG